MTASLEQTARFNMESSARADAADKFNERHRAPFVLRCGALLIDYILIAGTLVVSTLVARLLGGGARAAGLTVESTGYLLAFAAAILNLGLLPAISGRTVGKWATGLRLERRRDGRPVGIGRALLRHFIGYPLSFVPFGLGYLLTAFNAQGLALHDLIAQTVVVRDDQRRARPRRAR